ncbi:MAG: hypothetical protein NTV51_01590 [Verrucomicrobia bacterium]|nr:hypothetical protein [Verrucomicrobiota bacterium]
MKRLLFVSGLLLCTSALGQLSQAAASAATQQINAIMKDYTDTLVTPASGSDGVVVVSLKVLQSEKVAKLWTFIAATAVGKYFNDHPKFSVKEVWFSDAADLKARPARYAVLQLELAKRVQAQVYAGTMTLEEGQTKVWSSLVRKTKDVSK